jgi:hypothetical protein
VRREAFSSCSPFCDFQHQRVLTSGTGRCASQMGDRAPLCLAAFAAFAANLRYPVRWHSSRRGLAYLHRRCIDGGKATGPEESSRLSGPQVFHSGKWSSRKPLRRDWCLRPLVPRLAPAARKAFACSPARSETPGRHSAGSESAEPETACFARSRNIQVCSRSR